MKGQFYYRKAISVWENKPGHPNRQSEPKFILISTDPICFNPKPVLLEFQGAFSLIPIEFIKDAINHLKVHQKLGKPEERWETEIFWEVGTPISSKVAHALLTGLDVDTNNSNNKTPDSG